MSIRGHSSIHRSFVRAALAAAAFALAACSGDGPSYPSQLPAQYGSLQVTINGLPDGAQAGVTVTGPGGFSRAVTATTTLTQLSAGQYTVTVADVSHGGSTYSGAPASQSYTVAAGGAVTTPTISYTLATGTLSVLLTGLPQSSTASIIVAGPEGYSRTLTGATEITGLKPGQYSVEAREIQHTNARYAGSPVSQIVNVTASVTPVVAHVAYALSSGFLRVNINGLPAGAAAAVNVSGPGNYSRALTAETVLDNLVPGTYQITSQQVVSGSVFTATPVVQETNVAASNEATVATVTYTSQGTSLSVQVVGLPGTVPARATLTGPNGYSKAITGNEVISGLVAGTYTLAAQPVSVSCASYTVTPASQTLSIIAGQGAAATLTYVAGSAANLCIESAYITQSVQTLDNAVPLVAGRNGLLRVFVRSSAANGAQPPVRVRFYNGSGTLVSTTTIQAPSASVPLTMDESALGSSWNQTLTGAFIQPGLRLLLDVDPNNVVSEPNENDNTWPANGTPAALDVRSVSTMFVTLVPIVQAARGDTGRVDQNNKANFILPMQRMFPVANIDADVRAPYTYSGGELQSGGANWQTLLSELRALRTADANGRMYYGVVRVGYTSGAAGLGYIGFPTAIGWDHQPSGTEVMAHELGHNFGRLHAPCGNPAGVDGQYPYSGANIGVYGYDILSGVAKQSSLRDLMSYCDPSWISDYTYQHILNFRSTYYPSTGSNVQDTGASQRGLLVWGRIEGGRLVLEPGIEVDAPASLPTRGGPHRVEGYGPNGETLFSFSFAGERVADSPNDQAFAFVVPMTQLRGVELNRIRFSALGTQVEQRSAGGGGIAAAQRTAPGRVRVTWNASRARLAMIRDGRTGQILSFDRRGDVDVRTTSDDIEITLSDGVKSSRSRIRPR